jgi:hypothetical protein
VSATIMITLIGLYSIKLKGKTVSFQAIAEQYRVTIKEIDTFNVVLKGNY